MQASSLEELIKMISLLNPDIEDAIIRANPPSYKVFVGQLHKDIDGAVRRAQASRQYLKDSSEDMLTVYITDQLQAQSYFAKHDVANGGHVDIYVERKGFVWLGEAKIFSDNGYLMDGFYQLITRYSTGEYNGSCGGMIIYIKGADATKDVMASWRAALKIQPEQDPLLTGLEIADCALNPACFVSTHNHEISGEVYAVRHIPVNVYFSPRDGDKRPRMRRGRARLHSEKG